MVTFVGTQADFEKALKELLELEYEAVEGYEAAINRIERDSHKQGLSSALADHRQHIHRLTMLLSDKGIKAPTGPSGTQYITVGKMAIAELFGDKAILGAMVHLEKDTIAAYERMTKHEKVWPQAELFLLTGLADEKRHKAWMEKALEELG